MKPETTRVSDFKVAENYLRAVCKKLNVPFVDAGVTFTESPALHADATFDGTHVVVGSTEDLGKTLLLVIANYLSAIDYIVGQQVNLNEQQESHLIATAATVVREFMHSRSSLPEAWESPLPHISLSHFPFVWLTLRDIVVPLYESELKDIPVILDRSPQHDVAVLGEVQASTNDDPALAIFVNTAVESDAYRSAFLLVAAVKAYGLEPKLVVSDLLTAPEVKSKTYGFARLAFVEDRVVTEFLLALAAVAGLPDPVGSAKSVESNVWYKQAQLAGGVEGFGYASAWAAPQLMEAMLDPARGPDYTVKHILDPLSQKIWNRVADEKKRLRKADMNLEDMLRVVSKPLRVKPNVLLQGLLSEQRIW